MKFINASDTLDIPVDRLIVAGWTGRNAAAVQHHIEELRVLGVAPPSKTPLFYEVSASLMTQAGNIQVLGAATSGEAEPLLVRHRGTLWLGLASDHTDRELETTSVAASKQACPKVCARELWPFAAVKGHIDRLRLRSWIMENGAWVPYQDGALDQILPLGDLAGRLDDLDPAAMLCGTLPAIGGVRPAIDFRAELHDPVRDLSIGLTYGVTILPVVS